MAARAKKRQRRAASKPGPRPPRRAKGADMSPARDGAAPLAHDRPAPTRLERRDAVLAASVGGGCFALYALTACRTFYVGDSAELAAAAAVLGIPHPPGYPTFTLVTGLALRLSPFDRALAANWVVGLYAALAVALLLLLARRLGASRPAAAFGALSLAFGATFWAQGTATEVYGFDLSLGLLAAHGALSAARSPRATLLFGLLFGLWLGHRPLNLLYAPTLLGLAWTFGHFGRKSALPFFSGLVVSALPYLYLPLRSRANPAIDIGDPETWERFFVVVRGAPYVRHWTEGTFGLGLGRLMRHLLALPAELGLGALFAVLGIFESLRAPSPRTQAARFLVLTLIASVVVCVGYNALDIAVFLLPSSAVLALFAAFGADAVLGKWVDQRRWLGALAPLCALLLVPLNFAETDLSGHRLARQNAEDTLESAPPSAVVFVGGDTNIHGLWYLQAVEHRRPDVIVVSPGHVWPWYVEQLKQRHPSEPWPSYERGAMSQEGWMRAAADALGATHSLVATRSLPLDPFSARDGKGNAWGALPRGIVSELRPMGTPVDLGEHAVFTEQLFDRTMARLLPRPSSVDVDSASLYLEYALSLSQNGELFARSARKDLAKKLFRWVLDLGPDALEAIVRQDVRSGLGQELPESRLEARARRSLSLLEQAPGAVAP